MGRNLKCVQFMLFCCKIGLVPINTLLLPNLLCRDLHTCMWRKIEPKVAYVERKKREIEGMTRGRRGGKPSAEKQAQCENLFLLFTFPLLTLLNIPIKLADFAFGCKHL